MKKLFVLALSCALAACVSVDAGIDATTPQQLANSEWRMTAINGSPPSRPEMAMLSFTDDRMSASVGCNQMGGGWSVDDYRLVAGPIMSTKRGCPGPMANEEQALSELLGSTPAFVIDGNRLMLTGAAHEADFIRAE